METRPQEDGALSHDAIAGALREWRLPDLGRARKNWGPALDALMVRGHLEAAEFGARHFRTAYGERPYLSNLCTVFDRMPPAGPEPPFADDPAKDVQIERRDGAKTVLLLFCGAAQRLGAPLPVLHRWFARLPAHLIYLRDPRRLVFLQGLPSLGADHAAMLAALREIIASLQAERVLCYGNSAGVFAALRCALDVGADSVLAMGGPVNLGIGFNAGLFYQDLAARIAAQAPGAVTDLPRVYESAASPPRTRIVYGDEFWDDRLHAESMAHLPCVTLSPLKGARSHNAVMDAILRGQFDELLQWLVQP